MATAVAAEPDARLMTATSAPEDPLLARPARLSPAVSLRPEPFGALAYHFGNRRLSFLRHPDIVRVVTTMGEYPSVRAALEGNDIDRSRWPSFARAVRTMVESEMLEVDPPDGAHSTGSVDEP